MSHYLVAQMNGGRYNGTNVASPANISIMQTPAAPAPILGPGASYGIGWIAGSVGGVPAVWHDGITGAFTTDIIIEPQNSWGAVLLFNSFTVLALGAYQQIEAGVARLLAAQDPSPAGLSLSAFYLSIEAILALISLGVLWSVLRLRHWSRRFEQRPRLSILRAAWRLFWELVIPLLLLLDIPTLTGVAWTGLVYYQPDLVVWLLLLCVVLLITGITRVVLMVRALRRKQLEAPKVATSPSPSFT